MIATAEPQGARVAGFRTKLLVAMMLVVSAVTLLALYFAQRSLAQDVAEDLDREFQGELAALHHAQEVRRAALVERCRALVRKPRIHAALEDDALDLLYLSAENELQDVMAQEGGRAGDSAAQGLRAQFYRFLDRQGAVIAPPNPRIVGALARDEEAKLALPGVPTQPQIGYLSWTDEAQRRQVSEIIAMPIVSTETGQVIAALVLGFKPFEVNAADAAAGVKSGIWIDGELHERDLSDAEKTGVAGHLNRGSDAPTNVRLGGTPHLLFAKNLNPDSHYPPALEVCVYPLTGLVARQRQLRWRVLGAGAGLLLMGLAVSHVLSARLSAPVEELAVDSEEQRTQRRKAEAALETTSADLQRSARFSADASHQLKTPVTVLRAGLEELLARENLTPAECNEIAALIHQTYRLSSLIEDLLLLSRMDAGRLKLELGTVDLSHLIAASLDDLSALPDEVEVAIETDVPQDLHVAGEKRYTSIILQNLLENARKYNRPGGRIRLVGRVDADFVKLRVGNTGGPISSDTQAHIFERFHRGPIGENVPGYGLGLNLARELARLHGGDLRLVRSDHEWTEFEVTFRAARLAAIA